MAGGKKGKSTIENETINIGNESTATNNELENEINEQLEDEFSEEKTFNKTKKVDFNDVGTSEAEEKVEIDFDNEEQIKGFTASKSKQSTNTDNQSNSFYDDNTTEEELRQKIKDEENKSKEFKAKDFEEIARFIIFLLDASLSSLLRWWAKDNSDSAYSLGADKKNQLIQQLTLILVKYQTKFSIEFMFLITVLILYIPPFMRARTHRKEVQNTPIPVKQTVNKTTEKKVEKKIEEIVPELKVVSPVIERVSEELINETTEPNNDTEEIVIEQKPKKSRRKRGAPHKN